MSPFRTAEIIAVGSELLTPFRADTNSLTLTTRLNDLGIEVIGKSIAGDDVARLVTLVREALGRADLVVLTGGLGPTEDDVTRDAVARALDLALAEDVSILQAIEARFSRRGMPMPAINRRQAMVPHGAVVLANPAGTAPGLWIGLGDKAVALLPGPPRELRAILDGDLAPRLADRAGGRRLLRRVVKTIGRPESVVDEIAAPIYMPWLRAAIPIQTTILAAAGQIELHLSASGDDVAAIGRQLDAAVETLCAALGDIVYSADGRALEEVVGETLKSRHAWIAVAESCTGGGILVRLTDIAGQLRLRAGRRRRVRQRRQDRAARRAGIRPRGQRRGERAGRHRDGRRRAPAPASRRRRVGDRHRRAGWRVRGEARRHGRRGAVDGGPRLVSPHVPVSGRSGDDSDAGHAGSARHGPPRASLKRSGTRAS